MKKWLVAGLNKRTIKIKLMLFDKGGMSMREISMTIFMIALIFLLTGCNFIGKQIQEQKAENMINDYYQAIMEEDYEKAFEQLYLYDYDAETGDHDLRNGTSLSEEEEKAFYFEKIDLLQEKDYQLKDYEIVEVEYEDGHSFWHHIMLEIEQNGEMVEKAEVADVYDDKLLIGVREDEFAKYRDGKMNFEMEE
ncbi:hypothetical protein [Gracilibacillus sp. YIM 98692]|uniref:hypothetical protein n=1 Tax=Gracilibacillus sp. YIM 98692 TaxID=2663532 RepID=UPI0013D7FFF7|nr:hypothetical protein [Gracilibacillus sp. YIM 98692]